MEEWLQFHIFLQSKSQASTSKDLREEDTHRGLTLYCILLLKQRTEGRHSRTERQMGRWVKNAKNFGIPKTVYTKEKQMWPIPCSKQNKILYLSKKASQKTTNMNKYKLIKLRVCMHCECVYKAILELNWYILDSYW